MRGRLAYITLASLILASLPAAEVTARHGEKTSPPGQISIVTVNAKQRDVVGLGEFLRLFELTRALHQRPIAFDGGPSNHVAAPDIVVFQEMTHSNLEIARNLLNQRFAARYEFVGPENSGVSMLANRDTLVFPEETTIWDDVCVTEETPLKDGQTRRSYPIARFTEAATDTPFVVAGVHFSRDYEATGQTDCLVRNVRELRSRLAGETAVAFLAGDFNKRAVTTARECDVGERSAPFPWYAELTAPSDGGRVYEDAVATWHRRSGAGMAHEWTHEQSLRRTLCDGTPGIRRGRIDYVFQAGGVVAEAHADHPGWAGQRPGTLHPANARYSDHRFVWGRVVLGGPAQVAPPSAEPGAGGAIELSWEPSTEATRWVLLRGGPSGAYRVLDRLDPQTLSYRDQATAHGRTYRYALAAIGAGGEQGLESDPSFAVADARGPRVVRVSPGPGSKGVDRRVTVVIRFDEPFDASSVDDGAVYLERKDRRIGGRVHILGPRSLSFEPRVALNGGKTYRAISRPLRDRLGNRGERFAWRFTTALRAR